MDNVTVQDLILHSYDQKPIEFQQAFDTLVAGKLAAAIDNKKIEVAQSMFSDQPPSEDYESDSDQEEDQDGDVS